MAYAGGRNEANSPTASSFFFDIGSLPDHIGKEIEPFHQPASSASLLVAGFGYFPYRHFARNRISRQAIRGEGETNASLDMDERPKMAASAPQKRTISRSKRRQTGRIAFDPDGILT